MQTSGCRYCRRRRRRETGRRYMQSHALRQPRRSSCLASGYNISLAVQPRRTSAPVQNQRNRVAREPMARKNKENRKKSACSQELDQKRLRFLNRLYAYTLSTPASLHINRKKSSSCPHLRRKLVIRYRPMHFPSTDPFPTAPYPSQIRVVIEFTYNMPFHAIVQKSRKEKKITRSTNSSFSPTPMRAVFDGPSCLFRRGDLGCCCCCFSCQGGGRCPYILFGTPKNTSPNVSLRRIVKVAASCGHGSSTAAASRPGRPS